MNIYTMDIMTFFFVMLCCMCTFLILLLGFILYILGSSRVRQALLAMSLIKTAVDVFKDFSSAFKSAKSLNSKRNKTSKNPSEFVDVEFREKK